MTTLRVGLFLILLAGLVFGYAALGGNVPFQYTWDGPTGKPFTGSYVLASKQLEAKSGYKAMYAQHSVPVSGTFPMTLTVWGRADSRAGTAVTPVTSTLAMLEIKRFNLRCLLHETRGPTNERCPTLF